MAEMTDNPFYRLAPFIQDYIYQAKWETLRAIQVQTTQVVLDTPNHVLIMSGTASGKTEAAFLPALTDLYNRPSSSIGILYVGPLKALINDQFQRLAELLKETEIPVQGWHGDISPSKREKFLQKAQGVLQITPESLEAMLLKRQTDLRRLFGDLRFVVIDEVHAFIGSDRGRQVICQLQRLANYQTTPARRIGLSATIGDPQQAMDWLMGGTDIPVTLIDDNVNRRSVELGVDFFPESVVVIESDPVDSAPVDPDPVDPELDPVELDPADAALSDPDPVEPADEPVMEAGESIFENMYSMTQRAKKTLIFVNKRADAETITANLKSIATRHGTDDIYYIHHGSISAELREAAEIAMKDEERPAVTTATVTLELGIDLGQLDQVLQLNATHSVASFVQRLGRSGRRGDPSRLFFYAQDRESKTNASLGEQLPWNLLQTIAIIQLYVEEKWIEPPTIPALPMSLLYHQTMSILAASVELTPPELAGQVLTLAPFANVSEDQYRELLLHLLQIQHIERTETGSLIIGLAGEKLVNDYRFYATFEDQVLYQVRAESREIGTIHDAPHVGERVALAGSSWKVISINEAKRVLFVERIQGQARPRWNGGGIAIHQRIVQRVRQILAEDKAYVYLQPRAVQRLESARQLARQSGLLNKSILALGGNSYMLLPWQSSKTFETLGMFLTHIGVNSEKNRPPYYFETKYKGDFEAYITQLKTLVKLPPPAETLIADLPREDLQRDKYDKYIPDGLLKAAFIRDQMDVQGAIAALQTILNTVQTGSSPVDQEKQG